VNSFENSGQQKIFSFVAIPVQDCHAPLEIGKYANCKLLIDKYLLQFALNVCKGPILPQSEGFGESDRENILMLSTLLL